MRAVTSGKATCEGKTFLVVDFDEKCLNTIKRYLVMDGAKSVLTTDLVQDALHKIQTGYPPVDCIICAEDISPFTGVEFLKDLRTGRHGDSPYIRGIKFVMLTAHREADLVLAVKNLDVDGYIVKPIDYNSFRPHIHDALSRQHKIKSPSEYMKVDIAKAMRLPVLLRNSTGHTLSG